MEIEDFLISKNGVISPAIEVKNWDLVSKDDDPLTQKSGSQLTECPDMAGLVQAQIPGRLRHFLVGRPDGRWVYDVSFKDFPPVYDVSSFFPKWPLVSHSILVPSYPSMLINWLEDVSSDVLEDNLKACQQINTCLLIHKWVCLKIGCRKNLVGGWLTPPKNISQLGWLFPIYGKLKNVPNNQPEVDAASSFTPSFVLAHEAKFPQFQTQI